MCRKEDWGCQWVSCEKCSSRLADLAVQVDAIGLIMSCTSILYIATTPFILPRFQARLGSVKTLAWVTLTWPMLALLIPLAQKFAVSSRPMMWLVLLLQQTTKNFGNFAWP